MVSGYLTSTSFPRVDGWSTDPRVLGRHNRLKPLQNFNTFIPLQINFLAYILLSSGGSYNSKYYSDKMLLLQV